ncbi:IS701 family transposase [Streptomyces sp. NPDC017979]|uniref:IS701 family transposase n=1 Tax=Streptomyces sp. NPDC017979 TaxID=3365024 RepID=UPI0037A35172
MLDNPVESGAPGPLSYFFEWLDDQFTRAEPRRHAQDYLQGLLSPPDPQRPGAGAEDGRNRLLTTARWSEDGVRDRTRDMVLACMGSEDSVLVVAEDGFLKKGHDSAGVARQYSASSGRMDNYQIGLFLLHVDPRGVSCAIDRELLVPPQRAKDPVHRARAGIPAEAGTSREDLALAMVERALDAGAPARWVVADTPYYGDSAAFRAALETRRTPYVLASVMSGPPVTKEPTDDGFVRWRIGRAGGGSYQCYAPPGTELDELTAVAAQETTVRSHFASARREAGLDRYAVRKWRAWYRHMTLAMFAHAFLRVTQASGINEKLR